MLESQIIFYEFVQTTSKEHIDDDIKDHILEHIVVVFISDRIKIVDVRLQIKNDIDLCLGIGKCDFESMQSMAEISEKCSKYIIETTDEDFYKKQPYIYLLEKLLKDI